MQTACGIFHHYSFKSSLINRIKYLGFHRDYILCASEFDINFDSDIHLSIAQKNRPAVCSYFTGFHFTR
jgi:hypothetical protein